MAGGIPGENGIGGPREARGALALRLGGASGCSAGERGQQPGTRGLEQGVSHSPPQSRG